MILQELKLKRFRNFTDENIKVKNKLIVITGENGQGKTNLLEAIYFAAIGKSWRTRNHSELIKFNEENSLVLSEFTKNNLNKKIEIFLDNNGEKFIKINEKNLEHHLDYFGEINIVNFSPEDINIIRDAPSCRRNFINFFLAQTSILYKRHLSDYNRTVSQRNSLLDKNKKLEFEVWTEKLIEEGIWITEKRIFNLLKFAGYVKYFYSVLHQKIDEKEDILMILYRSSLGFSINLNLDTTEATKNFLSKDIYRSKLIEVQEKEIKYQETIIGPHRDDIIFILSNFDARRFSSRGEQRLLALSIKLACYKIIEETFNESPIVLIDDVLSELDEKRRGNFLKNLNNDAQIFIASTDEKIFDAFTSNGIVKLKIKDGKIYSA